MPGSSPRRRLHRIAFLLTIPGLAAPLTAFAAPDECLLDLNNRLLTPHHVSLRLVDGYAREGQLEFIDAGQHYVLFTPDGTAAAEPLRLRPAQIRCVTWSYHATNGLYIFGGMAGGAFVGLLTAAAATHHSTSGDTVYPPNPSGNGDFGALVAGTALGALTGGLLGTIVPLFHRHDVRVTCAEAEAR